jgi:2-methylisocitrate lyase-like PEP mutase family enzyme
VIADADTGFGNALSVMRTTREIIQAGAAAMLLEDQLVPKRCGHMADK